MLAVEGRVDFLVKTNPFGQPDKGRRGKKGKKTEELPKRENVVADLRAAMLRRMANNVKRPARNRRTPRHH